MTDEAKALVERLRELERDLKPFAHKTVGSIRIDLDEVRAIVGCPDLIETQAREIERLRDTPNRIWAEARDSEWDEGFNYAVKLFRAALARESHD